MSFCNAPGVSRSRVAFAVKRLIEKRFSGRVLIAAL